MPLIWGLYGMVGTGKSTVSNYLSAQGWDYINQDILGHEVLDENTLKLVSLFGEEITTNGVINRQKIGSLVFNNPKKLQKLIDFSYPIIIQKTLSLLRDVPTIIEGAFFYKVREFIPHTHLIYLSVELPLLRQRLLSRGHSEEWIQNVLDNQQDISKHENIADYILSNNKDIEFLHHQIKMILHQFI